MLSEDSPDGLGSMRQETDGAGAVVSAREWSPYGVEVGAAQAGLGYTGVGSAELAAAAARLESLFPPEFAPLLRQAVGQPVVTAQREHRQQMLMLLNRALLEGRKVRMVYETRSRGGATSERVVHPYHIMPYVRSWQLVAHCELREAVRMFKVDRIQEATLLGEHYRIPTDFDVDAYMGSGWGAMRSATGEPVDMVLRFEPEAGQWVSEGNGGVRMNEWANQRMWTWNNDGVLRWRR